MAGMKAFAKSLLCARDFRNFCELYRERGAGEEQISLPTFGLAGPELFQNNDIQLGDFFESLVQYSLVGAANNGEFVVCSEGQWSERVQRINSALNDCNSSQTYNPLIQLLEFEPLAPYTSLYAHPATLYQLKSIWKKFCKKFPLEYDIGVGHWAKEVPISSRLEFIFPEKEKPVVLNLNGRCDLLWKTNDFTWVIELKATKMVLLEHKYQLFTYGNTIETDKLAICHNGIIKPQENILADRINSLLEDPRRSIHCPGCKNDKCPFKY
jgi:hypothetical protein